LLSTSSRLEETPFSGEVLHIRFFGSPTELKVTPDHQVLTIDPTDPHNEEKHTFKKASELSTSDWGFKTFGYILDKPDLTEEEFLAKWPKFEMRERITPPSLTGGKGKVSKELLQELLGLGLTYQEIAGKVGLKTKGAVYQYTLLYGLQSSNNQEFSRNPLLDKDFWRLVGLWVAEGCLSSGGKGRSRNRIDWAFHQDELELHDIVMRTLDRYNIPSVLSPMKLGRGVKIRCSSVQLASFLGNNFKELAHHKELPSWFFHIPRGYQMEFLFGYYQGDGCNKGKENWATITSVSLTLLNQIQLLLASRFNHPSGVAITDNEIGAYEIKFAPIWPSDWGYKAYEFKGANSKYIRVDGDKLLYKVNYIHEEGYSGSVFDLTTEPARFTAGGVLVHNCFDPAGWLLDRAESNPTLSQWKVVKVPALLDKAAAKMLGGVEGESYWPEFYDTDTVKRMQTGMPRSHWLATYQQEPIALDGNIIKTEHFQDWGKNGKGEIEHVIASLDTAFSTSTHADHSVIQVWGVFNQRRVDSEGTERDIKCLVLLDQHRGKWEYPELIKHCQEVEDDHVPDTWLIEKKASGQSLIQDLRRRGYFVVEYSPDKDKLTRVISATPFIEDERIYMPMHLIWCQDFIDECQAFGGKKTDKDDQVDAMSQAVIWLRDSHYLNYEGEVSLEELEDERQARVSKQRFYW